MAYVLGDIEHWMRASSTRKLRISFSTWLNFLGLPLCSACRVKGSGFRVWGIGYRVKGIGFRVEGVGVRFGVRGFGFRF